MQTINLAVVLINSLLVEATDNGELNTATAYKNAFTTLNDFKTLLPQEQAYNEMNLWLIEAGTNAETMEHIQAYSNVYALIN